jgi:hypothetical protein
MRQNLAGWGVLVATRLPHKPRSSWLWHRSIYLTREQARQVARVIRGGINRARVVRIPS